MLKIKNVSFSYSKDETVLENITLPIKQGEYVAILGESGCGKSTLLEIIYGLMDLEKGEIYYNGEKLLGPKYHLIPGHEFMKYLAQDFSLMPYTTVSENIGEFLSNIYKDKKQQRIKELLEVVDMVDFADVKVKYLSGGQKQRVAIARVLAKEPKVLLLDEPFSHIDNFRKNDLRRKLFSYLKAQKISCVVATHDSTDALSFADYVHIIRNKKIIASGAPNDLYQNPKSKYIASFFNEVNEIPYLDLGLNRDGAAIVYPEQIKIVTASKIKARVTNSYFTGVGFLIEALLNKTTILINHHEKIEKDVIVAVQLSNPSSF